MSLKSLTLLLIIAANISAGVFAQTAPPPPAQIEKSVLVKADKIIVIAPNSKLAKELLAKSGNQDKKDKDIRSEEKSIGDIFRNVIKTHNFRQFEKELLTKFNKYRITKGFEGWKFIFLFCGILVSLILASIARWVIECLILKKLAKKTKTNIDDLIAEALSPPVWLFFVSAGIFVSSAPLMGTFTERIQDIAIRIGIAICAFAFAWGVYRLIAVLDHFMEKLVKSSDSTVDDLIANLVRKSLKITIIIVSALIIGQNILGLNITTLLAGAGVIGLAVAFAAQDTIGNFLGSIMLILDRPFKVGDRIRAVGVDGSVEGVGFRSTRVRTLEGHLVSIPNKELAAQKVENVGKRPFIKFANNFTLVYDTPAEKIELAVKILHEIYDNHEGMSEDRPPKIFFNSFNDWALNITTTIWWHPSDYYAAQEWNHKKNLEILRRFNQEGLEFAFPTNTTYLAYDSKRKLEFSIDNNDDKKGELS